MLYGSEQQLVAAGVPFLRAATDVGAPVVAVLDGPKREVLADELGTDAARVQWVDPGEWYTFPAHSLRRAVEFARDAGAPVRMFGEVVWAGRCAREVREWARYETVINVAFPDTPLLCAYDTRALEPAIVAIAGHTHPMLLHASTDAAAVAVPLPSETFVDAARFAARYDTGALPVAPETARMLMFDRADLVAVRHFATLAAVAAGLASDRCFDVITAVNEAATNAVEHGGGRGAVRTWTDGPWLVIEVISPDGQILDPFAGYLPPDQPDARARGMWLIRQLTDLVEIRTEYPGATVRTCRREQLPESIGPDRPSDQARGITRHTQRRGRLWAILATFRPRPRRPATQIRRARVGPTPTRLRERGFIVCTGNGRPPDPPPPPSPPRNPQPRLTS